MSLDLIAGILTGLLVAATPLILAALGELVVEKSGVLNLGVEGMMVIGAFAGFAAKIATGSYVIGFLAAILAAMMMGLLFGLLTQVLLSNQVATGLALTLFGLGLSALFGAGFTGQTAGTFPRLDALGLPGRVFAGIDALMLLTLALAIGVHFWLERTRGGLILRAVGENHDAAHAIGYPVVRVRLMALAFGGAMAGLGGAYLSLVQTPFWVERMTAGRGWIALALVVFAAWRPFRVLAGALLFGGISILQLHSQGFGLKIDAQVLSMLPYIATIGVLVLISRSGSGLTLKAPQSLGKVFTGSA
jgi:general nucleoside transport system permease protein